MACSSSNPPISIIHPIKIEPVSVSESETQQQSPNPNPNLVPSQISNLQSIHAALSTFLESYSSFSETLDSISSSLNSTKHDKNTSLDFICQNNQFKPLRQYISTHISDLPKLRREVPQSLALSPNPPRLVLNVVGKFYIRGRKAYEGKDEQAILVRRISILLLEYYLLAGCPVGRGLDTECEKDAMAVAVTWRKRLLSEGGVDEASPVDALGLSLFVGCFGVPRQFGSVDLYWLLKLSNLKRKGGLLKKSNILMEKMPYIINDLIKKEMNVEAVDLICTFGLEDKFEPIPLLCSVVEKTCEDESGHTIRSLKEAHEKQLNALKSVVKCIEEYNLDSTELTKSKISQKISKYENEITKLERKLREKNVKRKIDNVETLRDLCARAKRHMLRAAEPPFRKGVDQGTSSVHDSRHSMYNDHTADVYASQVKASFRQSLEQGISSVQDSRYATYNGCTADVNAPQGVQAQNIWYGNASAQAHAQAAVQLHNQSPAASQIHNQSSGAMQNYYQPPASNQIHHQSPATMQNYYQPSAVSQIRNQPHSAGQIRHHPPAAMQNYYQPPASGQIQYQPSAADQNQYYPTALTHVNEGWKIQGHANSQGNALPTANNVTNPIQQ